MATYRPEAYLREQVASVFNQQGVTIRLLISDDSEDKSLVKSLLIDASAQDGTPLIDQINVIEGPQVGLASANFFNLLLKNPDEADFYAFADQDDIWRFDKLSEAIRLLLKTGSDCYSSELNIWSHPESAVSSVISRRWRIKKDLFGFFFAESAGCTYVMSRTAFLSLKRRLMLIARKNLLHLAFSHDLFASAYLHSQGFKWCHDKRSMIYYRQHQSNAWGANVMSLGGLQKRLSLLTGQRYYNLLYLAWMGGVRGTNASQLWQSLSRLGFRDRLYLLRSGCKAIAFFNPKAVGLLVFVLFAQKRQPSSAASDISSPQ